MKERHTMIIATQTATGLNWIAEMYKTFKTAFALRINNRRAIQELESLTNRELADIGINRSMIRSKVKGDSDV